jgi:hypothetical protein
MSHGIAGELKIELCPFAIWPGGDNYRSLAKLVAELTVAELKNKSESELSMKDKKLIENYPNTIANIPCIIDQVVNVGLTELAEQWEEVLKRNGRLWEEPALCSVFDE